MAVISQNMRKKGNGHKMFLKVFFDHTRNFCFIRPMQKREGHKNIKVVLKGLLLGKKSQNFENPG
jgi:hypothetical protein